MTGLEIALAGTLAFGQLISKGQQEIVKYGGVQVIHADGAVTLRLQEKGRREIAEQGGRHVVILLADESYPFEVTRHVKSWDDCRAVETWHEIRHGEKRAVKLLRADSFAAALSVTTTPVRVLSLNGCWGNEANVRETELALGQTLSLLSRNGTRDAWEANAGMMVSFGAEVSETRGKVLGLALEWTGTTDRRVSRVCEDRWRTEHTEVFAGVDMTTGPYTLDPNTTFTTPHAILVWSEVGRGEVSRQFHRWARRHLMPHGRDIRPVLLNSWEGSYFRFTEATLTNMMAGVAEMGGEMFVLDDGWFGNGRFARDDGGRDKWNGYNGLGDWVVNTNKLPHGLGGLSREARRRGLGFGLWVEPEMANLKSELAEAHPDWILCEPKRSLAVGRGGTQVVLDYANPAVRQGVWESLDRAFGEAEPLAYVKWDSNQNIVNPGSPYLAADRQPNLWYDYTMGLYDVLAKCRAKRPDTTIQACASGGGHVDFGMLRYCDEFWTSDCTDPLRRVFIQWGTSFFYPANAMACHVTASPNHQTGRKTPLKYRFDVAMTGRLGFELHPADLTPDELAFAKAAVADYKRIRQTVQQGDLYRIESPYDHARATLMYVSEDCRQAVVFVLGLDRSGVQSVSVNLPGLADGRYSCQEINCGLRRHAVTLDGRRLTTTLAGPYDSAVFVLAASESIEELVDTRHGAVDPSGKAMSGRCLIGPCTPHGAISPGPDTLFPQNSKWPYPSPSGYHPSDEVVGFSHLHAHGTGGHPTYGLFLVSPTTNACIEEVDLASPMKILTSRPSLFRCALTRWGTDVSVTAGRQTALYRFAFPKDAPRRRIVVNAARKIGKKDALRSGGIRVAGRGRPDHGVSGGGRYGDNWNPAEYDCFFAAEFDVPPIRAGKDASGKVAWFEFDAETVQMKMAISFSSEAKAHAYLDAEQPDWNFDRLRMSAAEQWNRALGAVRAEGFADETKRRVFYANLYHTMIQPRDRTGDVPGWRADEPVWDDHYTLWDTWKTLYPLMSIIAPDHYASIVNSFGARLRHNGECAASYIQTKEYRTGQSGDDVDNVIADAYAKKIPGIDWKAAAEVLKFHAAERTPDYLEKGYVCSDVRHPKYCYRMASGSGTLGFAYNDWCAAQVLKGLGETALAARLEARSGNWTNVWDDALVDPPSGYRGFARGKDSHGRWRAKDRMNREKVGEFLPRQGFNSYFYEGTCWDYSFTIYNDIPGMIAKMGGREKFAERLEYALKNNLIEFGNEPSFMTIWMFDFVGQPDKCSFWANRLREKFERWGNGWAVPGDDDSGAMGSLYVFLTAGFFPIAGTDLYMLHGPSVEKMTFDLGHGRAFVVRAKNVSRENRFVKSVTLTPSGETRGRAVTTSCIRHADIARGGVLEFEMTSGR